MPRLHAAALLALLGAAGCEVAEPQKATFDPYRDTARDTSMPQVQVREESVVETVFDRMDYQEIDRYNGKYVTIRGQFDHVRATHGSIRLEGGLVILLPHFDQFQHGDDWLKYVGKRCLASGFLHTYTRDLDPYHGPTLQVNEFHGPGE
jgi:hypothetical protein